MINDQRYLVAFKPKGYPVRHKHKELFDPAISVSPEFASRVKKIRELDNEFERFILTADDYFNLVTDASASNIHWSTKIEGNPLSENEVRKVTRETLSGNLEERNNGPNQEIINHLVNLFYPDAFKLPWAHKTICILHSYLLDGTGNPSLQGMYRKKHVMAGNKETGEENFIAAPPEFIEREIGTLLDWTNDQALVYDPIIAATVMFHEFESIHPFEDGNGRTGRCLFHLYLQDRALKNSHLCKIDNKMVEDSELYYDLLGYADETGSYKELLDLVSIAILKSYEEAKEILSGQDLLSSELNENAKRILIKAKSHKEYFSIKEARSWIDNLSDQTVGKYLAQLEELGALESIGHTKSLRYRMKDPLIQFKEMLKKNSESSVAAGSAGSTG